MAQLKYRCVFPGCNYETDERRLIEFHHVNPKELRVKLNKDVTIELCPVHHKMIYHPLATSGQHAIKDEHSLSVVQVANTTTGKAVIFRDMAGHEITVEVDSRPPKPSAIYALSWSLVGGIAEQEVDDCDSYVEQQVDMRGFHQVGNTIYYNSAHCTVAHELLKAYITQYMVTAKAEFFAALAKARADYRQL